MRNSYDYQKQFKTSDLVGGHFLPEYVKHAIQTEQVTLIGHAMGARAVFNSLRMWDSSLPLIKNVVLLGGILPAQGSEWSQYSEKVSGRIWNAYNDQDPVLKQICQFSPSQDQFCGLAPIDSTSPQLLNLNSSEPVGQSHCSVDYLTSLLQVSDAEFRLCQL